jgi:replication initiation protein RepC
MTERFMTTPFGGARISAASFRRNHEFERQRAELKSGFRQRGRARRQMEASQALTEAKTVFGVSDRAIVVLEALLSFHQGQEIDASGEAGRVSIQCGAFAPFPRHGGSNAAAAPRCFVGCRPTDAAGQPERQALLPAQRQWRYRKRLRLRPAPLALMATRIFEAADIVQAEARAAHRLRGEITIHLRDISKVLEAGIGEKRPGNWLAFATRLAGVSGRTARIPAEALEQRCQELLRLRAEVEHAYLNAIREEEMSGNAIDSERHIQNSKLDTHFEKAPKRAEAKSGSPSPIQIVPDSRAIDTSFQQ